MSTSQFIQELQAIIQRRHLLHHQFYQMWNRGTLPLEVLQRYAEQYYHFETAFPRFLSRIHMSCDELDIRQTITDNIYDEEHGPENHRELWLRFGEGIGATRKEMQESIRLPETENLLQTFSDLAASSTLEGVAALATYESQIPTVSASKIAGLKKNYQITDQRTLRFFKLHGEVDVRHANAWWKNIQTYATTPELQQQIKGSVTLARDGLWDFLDGICRAYLPDMKCAPSLQISHAI